MRPPIMLNVRFVRWPKHTVNGLLTLTLIALAIIVKDGRRQTAPATSIAQSPTVETSASLLAMKASETGRAPKGLTVSDWTGIKGEYERHRHAAVLVNGEYRARNYRQQLLMRFDGRGFAVEPKESSWRWGLELQSYGFAGRERSVQGQAQVKTEIDRVTYAWSDELDEWFVNDRRGLEHGFTLKARPPRHEKETGLLQLRLQVRGELRPRVQADKRTVSFVDRNDAVAVNYSGLKVWDAEGQELAAHFRRDGEGVSILVEESAARYPLMIDPIVQQAYLKASNVEENDQFGTAVAISEDTAVVGAPLEASNATGVNGDQSNDSLSGAGAVYVFVRSGGMWSQQAYLKASNTGGADNFGTAVAISGNTIVVGAPSEDSDATGINGDGSDNSADGAGAAYVFVRSGEMWSQQAYLKASNTGILDGFGTAVAISGETIVIGALGESSAAAGVNGDQNDDSVSAAGAAYVFVRNSTTWSQQAYLKASNPGFSDTFGFSVAISGDTVVIGAPLEASNASGVNGNESDNSAFFAGAAYVFVRSGGAWSQQAYLKASNTGANDQFGWTVAISGETIVVGAPQESSMATGVDGNGNDNSAFFAGAAYIYVRNGSTWSSQAYLKASNTWFLDNFGWSVTIYGDTVVVGAPREASSATGVNGDQDDDSFENAGAVYAFVRSGTAWTQQAYLKASNTGEFDSFGYSVAIAAETLVVGALGEASGVIGNQSNNSADGAGAVYVFNGVGNISPTITANPGVARQAGSPSSNSNIATVNDKESGASGVTVTINGGASATVNAVTVSNIVNTNGMVTADIIAACGATNASFTLTATDGSGNTKQTTLNVNVTANIPPNVSYPAMQGVALGGLTIVIPTASDNGTIGSFSIVSVTPALTIAPTINANGVISITGAGPSGDHTITVKATDNCGLSTNVNFILSVGCNLLLPGSVAAGTSGTPYSASVTATPSGGLTYSLLGGSLPPGLTLNSMTGIISGTPNTVGTYNFTVKSQGGGCSAVQGYVLTIGCPTITVSPSTLSNGTVGSGYNVNFSATPAAGYQFNLTAGTLPAGLSLNVTTGVLSGTPTTASTYNFTITAKAFGSCTGSRSYTLTINPAPCPTVTLSALPNGKVGQLYSSSVSASPSGSYSYGVTSGSLPPGMSLIGSVGLLIGTPTTANTYNFTITATRSGGGGCTGSRSYTVTVAGM